MNIYKTLDWSGSHGDSRRVFGILESKLNRRWLFPLLVTAGLFAVLLFLFPYNSGDSSVKDPLGITLWQIWTVSNPDSDHTYCLLVPAMLAYLLYEKRADLVRTPGRGINLGLVAILAALLLFWLGSRAGKQYLGCGGLQLLVMGVIYWFWGTSMFRKLLFGWAILCFAWPLPFFDTAVAFPLRMIVSHSAFLVLNAIGVPCLQNGTALISAATSTVPVGGRFQIDVADPCSGLHSLLPLLMFSSFYCYFFLHKRWQQWTAFLSSFIFTIAGNIVRIVMLVLGSLAWGSPFAVGTNDEPSSYHEACGFAVFVFEPLMICFFGYFLVWLDHLWMKRRGLSPAPAPAVSSASARNVVAATDDVPLWRSGLIAGLIVVMLGVYWITPPIYLPSEASVLMSLPDQVTLPSLTDGGDFLGNDAPVSDVEHHYLPKDTEYARKNYDDFHNHQIFFSIVLSGVQQYLIHPPEICLVAQGWTILGHQDMPVKLASGHELTVRNLSLQRDTLDEQQHHVLVKAYYMYWYVADDITTPSHEMRNWISCWDRVFHNRDHRWAYVIAMSAITKSYRPDGLDADQTRDMMTAFIRQVVPTFQKDEFRSRADNS